MKDLPHTNLSSTRQPLGARGGFTLLEALMAAVILGASVLAVISAISSAQSLSFEGQKRVLAAMSAGDLMSELTSLPYDDLRTQNPINQSLGQLAAFDGGAYPATYWAISRAATMTVTTKTDQTSGSVIRGVEVVVTVSDEGTELCRVESFVAEPSGTGGST